MVGMLLVVFGLLASVIGWRVVWRVRAFARRISRPAVGPQRGLQALRFVPWRLVPGVGEAVLVWNRRARLAKLLALPVLAVGPLMTVLGVFLLAHEVHGLRSADTTPLTIGAGLAVMVLVWRYVRRSRRPVDRDVSAGRDQTW
jgi:hypothetical protein